VGSGRVLLHPRLWSSALETETKGGIGCEAMHSWKRGASAFGLTPRLCGVYKRTSRRLSGAKRRRIGVHHSIE
jgi:hypothetical protein